jgi:hypothetical protein
VLGIAPGRLRAMVAEGRIAAQLIGGARVFYRSDVEEFARRPRHIGRPRKTIAALKAKA